MMRKHFEVYYKKIPPTLLIGIFMGIILLKIGLIGLLGPGRLKNF